jgi:hypothetical protein
MEDDIITKSITTNSMEEQDRQVKEKMDTVTKDTEDFLA